MSDSQNNEIVPVDDMSNLPAIPESALNLAKAVKIPLEQLPTLGVFASALPEAFRTVSTKVTTGGSDVLYRVTDVHGNVLTPNMLQQFRDGSGLLGSVKTPDSFTQARLHAIDPQSVTQTLTTTAPFDPATVFIAAALAEINEKLDAIRDMQEEMFAYAKLRDHADVISAFKTLEEIRESYRFNSSNDSFLTTRHQLVSSARQKAEKAIEMQRGLLESTLKPIGALHLTKDVTEKTKKMVEAMREYQLASYLYCYSTLMDVVLVGNYDPAYLESVETRMERHSQEYFELYSKCADRIEHDARGSLGALVAGGIGTAGSKLGRLVESTPVGDKTQIDEALLEGAKAMKSMSRSGIEMSVKALTSAKPGFMRPFIDSVGELDRLHNEPVALAVGEDSVYVLPLG